MSETRVFRTLISIETQTELLDPAQPLKFRGIDQANYQPSLVTVVAQRNNIVDRIAIDSLGQVGSVPGVE